MKLVLFDVDGTLVDSQGDILAAMARAFGALDLPVPDDDAVRGIVGLSLPVAMATLRPDLTEADCEALAASYREAYITLRHEHGVAVSSPLYPGVAQMLERLGQRDDLLLGVATGKSRRGLDKLIDGHGLRGRFVTEQTADHHPSKPHPSMVLTAMDECGVEAADTVVIGDTRFDMEMAAAAGAHGIGVSWGYHPAEQVRPAFAMLETMADLPNALAALWGEAS